MAGRPRSFDPHAALIIAMERFWRDGYEATTVARLTADMGIAAPSLYAAFGDKDQLFEAAAECYFERVVAQTDHALDRSTAHEGLADLLRMTAAAHSEPSTPPGCFMLSEPRLAPQRDLLRERIARRIARGVAEGDMQPDVSPDAIADFLIAVLTGMSARAKEGGGREALMAIVELALAALPAEARAAAR